MQIIYIRRPNLINMIKNNKEALEKTRKKLVV